MNKNHPNPVNEIVELFDEFCSDKKLKEIESLGYTNNFFKITKISNLEIRHSNFLAWLFNPNESHGFGDEILKSFIKRIYSIQSYLSQGLKDMPVILNCQNVYIDREKDKIDVIIDFRDDKKVIVIENKTKSHDSKNQLNRYHQLIEMNFNHYKQRIYIYLTPHGEEPKYECSGDWICIGYEVIEKAIDDALKTANIDEKVKIIVNDYLDILRRDVMKSDSKMKELCISIYREHKQAIDLINEYAGDTSALFDGIEQKINSNKKLGLTIAYKSSSCIRLAPEAKHNDELGSDEWFKGNKHLILFEIASKKDDEKLNIRTIVGPINKEYEQALRVKIVNKFKEKGSFKIANAITPTYTTLFSDTIISKTRFRDLTQLEMVDDVINYFKRDKFKKTAKCIVGILKNMHFDLSNYRTVKSR